MAKGFDATALAPAEDVLLFTYAINISHDGVYVRANRPLAQGVAVSLDLQPGSPAERLQIEGVVVRAVDHQDQHPRGMGIAFVFDSPSHKAAVQGRLDRLMVASLGPTVFEQLMGRSAPPLDGDE